MEFQCSLDYISELPASYKVTTCLKIKQSNIRAEEKHWLHKVTPLMWQENSNLRSMSPSTTQPSQVKGTLLGKQNQETNCSEVTSRGDPSPNSHVLACTLILQSLLQSQPTLQNAHRDELGQFPLRLTVKKLSWKQIIHVFPTILPNAPPPPSLYNSILASTRSYTAQKACWTKH